MPSKLNTEFTYRYLVIGDTVWEKIKTLQGFLEGRVSARALEEAAHLKHDAKLAKMEWMKEMNAPLHEQLVMQAELLELATVTDVTDKAYELNRQEIVILEKLLAECYEIAEPTRIHGYTDEQMFEENAANEFTTNTLREMQSEIAATGRPFPATVLHVMSNPHTLNIAIKSGFFPEEAIPLLVANPVPLASPAEHEKAMESAALMEAKDE
jgi:hypothetical protein|tara:strand:- start:193 stop:825 length:633 start_codon:yes stop_codon:yes gene_type:complete